MTDWKNNKTQCKELGRIRYVEPNDIEANGQTPDYTDYCISCNLTVDRSNRLRTEEQNSDETYNVQANFNSGDNPVSFFMGESKDYSYLTTDYSEIHFNTVKKRTILEGLQISGIDISYANFFSPDVVIHMVDIRGGGLFGREEVIHGANGAINYESLDKDDNDKLIDNIYSGFMTMPYPRYRLQIKGFYGRAVTYQLICTNFDAKFDSSTGNVNITVKFSGLEYGCLQDIPLPYIVAAPYTRSGRAYWNTKVASDEWNVSSANVEVNEQPMLLWEFFYNIKSAMVKNPEVNDGKPLANQVMNFTKFETMNNLGTKKSLIEGKDGIKQCVSKVVEALTESNNYARFVVVDDDKADGDKIVVILNSNSKIDISKDCCVCLDNLKEKIMKYNNLFPGDNIGDIVPIGNFRNGNAALKPYVRGVKIERGRKLYAMSYDYAGNFVNEEHLVLRIKEDDGYAGVLDTPSVKILQLNSGDRGYSLNSKQAIMVFNAIQDMFKQNIDQLYAAVIVFRGYRRLDRVLSELEDQKKLFEQTDGELKSITEITGGITPYIGNYFKMVFCHIDTFVHTIWECVDDIYKQISRGDRTIDKLGIKSYNMTDIRRVNLDYNTNDKHNENVVPPFPGIYANYSAGENVSDGLTYKVNKSLGWVGNVKGLTSWVEERLVSEYYAAIRNISFTTDDMPWVGTDDRRLDFNLLPCFVSNEFSTKLYRTRDGMAYYIAIMSELMLGAMNDKTVSNEECEAIGAILAKKIYDECDDKETLLNRISGDNIASDLYNISLIKRVNGNGDSYRFEFFKGYQGDDRHRIFTEKSNEADSLDYVYMLTSNKKPIIPLNSLSSWGDVQKVYERKEIGGNDGSKTDVFFVPNPIVDGKFVVNGSVSDLVEENAQDGYMNSTMFSTWIDVCNVELLEKEFEDYKANGYSIGLCDKNKIMKYIINKYWLMHDNFTKYQSIEPSKMVPVDGLGYKDGDIDDEMKKKFLNLEY